MADEVACNNLPWVISTRKWSFTEEYKILLQLNYKEWIQFLNMWNSHDLHVKRVINVNFTWKIEKKYLFKPTG